MSIDATNSVGSACGRIAGSPNVPTPSTTNLTPAPLVPIGDPAVALELLQDASAVVNEKSEQTKLDIRSKEKAKAIKEHLDAICAEAEQEAKKGSGFFGSIGTIVKDVFHDAVTLHAEDLVTDVKDDTVKALTSKQFWTDLETGAVEVAKWGAVASSIAVAVATCGSGTAGAVAVTCAVVGAGLSTAAAVESEGHLLQKAGWVNEKQDGWIVIAGSFGGAATSAVGGFIASSQMTASGATALSRAVTRLGTETAMASGAADVAGGAAHGIVSKFDSDLAHAQTDTKAAEMHRKMLERVVKELGDELNHARREREENHRAALTVHESFDAALDKSASWRA